MPASGIWVDDADPATRFTLATYNVDQSMREEKVDETKWVNRAPRIRALIHDMDADILCLQEFRRLPGVKESAEQFLASLDPYRFVIDYRNASPLAFGQAILYKPSKFFPLKTEKFWLSETPDEPSDTWSVLPGGTTGYGYIVHGILFQPVVPDVADKDTPKLARDRRRFWVFNVHLGLEEELKTKSCAALVAQISKITQEPFIVCGDFNLFPDKEADAQRRIMLNEGWIDAGRGALTLAGKVCEGTFIGYGLVAFCLYHNDIFVLIG